MTTLVPNINENRPPGVIVGILIGLLFLLVLGVAIAVVVLYMKRRRQAEGNYSTERKDNGKLHSLGKQLSVPCTLSYYFMHLQII